MRLFLILESQPLGIIRTPHKYPIQLPLTLQPTTRREEPAVRRQSAASVADEARQHLPAAVVGALLLEIPQELLHRGPLIVGVELEIHVVNEVAVAPPQSHVMALNLVVVERRDRSERNDAVLLQSRDQLPDAVRERARVSFEVLVVDVDAVEVVLLDDLRQRGDGVGDPALRRRRVEVRGLAVAAQAERYPDVGVLALDGGDLTGAEIVRVPEYVELAVRRRWGRRLRRVVDGERKYVVELDARVYRDVGEPHVFELCSEVFSEHVRVSRR